MLKFVRQGDQVDQSEAEWGVVSVAAVPEPKDDDRDCSVCKTRRRSLERQTAGVLRRTRSRETLRSVSNNSGSSTGGEDAAWRKSLDTGPMRVEGGGGGWSAMADKYRRLSRSCEALSMTYKGGRGRSGNREDIHENLNQAKRSLLSRINPRKTASDQGRSNEASGFHFKESNGQALIPDGQSRQVSVKKTGYCHSLLHPEGHEDRRSGPASGSRSKRDGGAAPALKQVQFGGVDYERSKEGSVLEKLRNVVSSHRRRLRSRSLERVDRRGEWNREERPEEGIERTSSQLWVEDKEVISHGSERQAARDHRDQQQQQHRHCKRRSRSRSKERTDETKEGADTRQHPSRHDDHQHWIVSPAAPQRDETCSSRQRRRSSSGDRSTRSESRPHHVHDSTVDSQYINAHLVPDRSSVSRPQGAERNSRLRPGGEAPALICPQYLAPNGHYGNAVVRKCPRGHREYAPRNGANVLPDASYVAKDSAAISSGQTAHPKANRPRDTVPRSSVPKLEKCGISAKKIAKLDSPLRLTTPNLSVIENVAAAPTISTRRITEDAEIASRYPPHHHRGAAKSSGVNGNDDSGVSDSGFVYNCTTSKITKLNRPREAGGTYGNCEVILPQQRDQAIEENTSPTLRDSNQSDPSGADARKHEGVASDLVRHASVASLSLISVNSVDSGTSCLEGSTTDSSSSSSSSDKEMETHQGKPRAPLVGGPSGSSTSSNHQRLEEEIRRYATSSGEELERLILASYFGRRESRHAAAGLVVTSDYESDTGPDGAIKAGPAVALAEGDGRRRKTGAARVVRFAGGKSETDPAREQQPTRPTGQITKRTPPTSTQLHHFPDDRPTTGSDGRLTTELASSARVLRGHKALSGADKTTVQRCLVAHAHLTPEDFAHQRPPWAVARSPVTGETGLVPSAHLASQSVRETNLG